MFEQIEGFRLSSQQSRLWLLQQGGPAYTALCALRLRGGLDVGRLREALNEVVADHEILRTTFARLPGVTMPLQVVAGRAETHWQRDDLSGADEPALRPALEAIYERERGADFDLGGGPPVRLTLVRLSTREHVLIVCAPALCADARTLANIAGEVCRRYAGGGATGDEPSQYADFAEWQSEAGGDEQAARGRAFWANKDLSGVATLRLPYAETMLAEPAFAPLVARVAVSADAAARVAAHAGRHATTEANFLLACWQVLLWRLTAHCDVTVGVAFDGRSLAELGSAFGPFARCLPIASQLRRELTFREALEQTDAAVREADEWQDYFTWDGAESEAAAASAFAPASFEYASWPGRLEGGGLSVSLERLYALSDRFKLKLSCVRAGDSLAVELHYDSQVFPSGVSRIAEHFTALLEDAARDPEAPIGRLAIVGEAERRRLLEEFSHEGEGAAPPACVHRLFEEQARRMPDSAAVAFEDERLTFAALNGRANRLAHYLRAGGVGPEVRVGICVGRSAELVVALLGVLKAGGAYVPLDPSHPRERIGMMLADAGAAVLLTERRLLAALPEHDARVVCLDDEPFAGWPAEDPESGVGPGNLAYVIYTSGSTGRPKGVAVEHRQLCNYVVGISRRLDLPARANYAVISTFSADLGNTVVFPSLCVGGCLHVLSQERATDPEAFADYAEQARVDCLKIVPSHFESLLTSTRRERAVPLGRLILGGETSRWDFIRVVEGLAPACRVYNHYGPTETTVGVTTYRVGADAAPGAAGVPLGRPLPGTRVYLLDPGRGPMPEGLAGELCVTGAGLARGYFGRPELTAERFTPDPYSSEPGARMYPTGDLARFLPGGSLEFLGRADSQIKFHGHRVELGEIRQALRRHPQIRDGVVTVARDEGAGSVIIAYYVSKQELEVGELRDLLSATVIRETVPNYFVHLKRIPLTLNGKVNYRALPTLEEAKQQRRRAFVAPRTPAEEKIAAVWAHFLGVERVSVDDNFFELGGHSLLATRIISRLRRELEVEVPLQSLFEAPTVAGLAAAAGAGRVRAGAETADADAAGLRKSTGDQLSELALLSEEEVRALLEAEARL
jgi:amino acid adenylation domain-containing protein